jgi:hypothetical protein
MLILRTNPELYNFNWTFFINKQLDDNWLAGFFGQHYYGQCCSGFPFQYSGLVTRKPKWGVGARLGMLPI